jgi:hypothetical protein
VVGQQTGSVRPLDITEVIALLTSVTEGTLTRAWDVRYETRSCASSPTCCAGPG